MKKVTTVVIIVLLATVLLLAGAVGWLLGRNAGGAEAEADPSPAVSPAPDESSEEPEPEPSDASESSSAGPDGEITGLRCCVQLGVLNIVEGEDFSASELNGSDYEAYVEDGTYVVNGSTTHDNHIVVTIPTDYPFQTVELVVTGGALTADHIHTQHLLTNCDKGALDCSGSVDAGADIQQLQGKTVVTLSGGQTDYNYDLNIHLGHIGIGGQQYAGPEESQSIDNGAEKAVDVSCTMGSVSVLFSDAG